MVRGRRGNSSGLHSGLSWDGCARGGPYFQILKIHGTGTHDQMLAITLLTT